MATLNPNGFRQYQVAIEVLVDLARKVDAEPILMTQACLVYGSNVLTSEQRKQIDYPHVGLSHEALVETFDRLDGIVRNVSAAKGTILIDASAHLSGKDWALYDHVHVAAKGSDALAQLIADHLRSILKR